MHRIGVIDIGTVSVRMGIADIHAQTVQSLTKKTKICNLGEGLDETGELDPGAQAKVLDVCASYVQCFLRNACDGVVCSLTQAAREASDLSALENGLRKIGLEPQIIEGTTEGALTALGASSANIGPYPIVADSGGGSTEICLPLGDGAWEIVSTPAGCRRVSERFFARDDPPTPSELNAARTWCRHVFERALSAGFKSASFKSANPKSQLVVTGGTATTLAAIMHKLERYDPVLIQGTVLTQEEIRAIATRLANLTLAQRANMVGVQPKRAPVILGGVLILVELMKILGYEKLMVSEADGLQGLALVSAAILEGDPSPIGWTPLLTKPQKPL